MKLYNLFTDVSKLDELGRLEFYRNYRASRAIDLEQNFQKKKKKVSKQISASDKALLKKMGISMAALRKLKES